MSIYLLFRYFPHTHTHVCACLYVQSYTHALSPSPPPAHKLPSPSLSSSSKFANVVKKWWAHTFLPAMTFYHNFLLPSVEPIPGLHTGVIQTHTHSLPLLKEKTQSSCSTNIKLFSPLPDGVCQGFCACNAILNIWG